MKQNWIVWDGEYSITSSIIIIIILFLGKIIREKKRIHDLYVQCILKNSGSRGLELQRDLLSNDRERLKF